MTEIWKPVIFNLEGIGNLQIEVSNLGRVRRLNSNQEYSYLQGSRVNGYAVIRLKAFKEREPKDQEKINDYREQIDSYQKEISDLKKIIKAAPKYDESIHELKNKIKVLTIEWEQIKKKYKRFYRAVELKRNVAYGGLVHRMVAEQFLEKPSENHNLVAHLNFDKLDNWAINLKWMTREENVEHQKKSPYVIQRKRNDLMKKPHERAKYSKLTVSNVMIIKKRINEGMPLTKLAKKYKVSEMQLSRIKRGENWKHVPAAL